MTTSSVPGNLPARGFPESLATGSTAHVDIMFHFLQDLPVFICCGCVPIPIAMDHCIESSLIESLLR